MNMEGSKTEGELAYQSKYSLKADQMNRIGPEAKDQFRNMRRTNYEPTGESIKRILWEEKKYSCTQLFI